MVDPGFSKGVVGHKMMDACGLYEPTFLITTLQALSCFLFQLTLFAYDSNFHSLNKSENLSFCRNR